MAHLPQQFDEAQSSVEPTAHDKSNAATAHEQVRATLESDSELARAGVDTVLIGSYARSVSIRRMKDVDVFSQLPDLPASVSATDALSLFNTALEREFGPTRVKRRTRTVEVGFPEFDLVVDGVPARPAGAVWEIPDRNEGWVQTSPLELNKLTSQMNGRVTLGETGVYVPMVKLIRQIRRQHFAKYPAGVYFEILAYWAFDGGMTATSWADYLTKSLDTMQDVLRSAIESGLPDPTMPGGVVETKADVSQLQETLARLDARTKDAEDALADVDECRAAKKWRSLLGSNDDGPVFPMPEHCDDEGRSKVTAAVTPGFRSVPSGEGKFAW